MEAVKAILDNTGQGLLTFGEDLLINPEYSAECNRIFGENIEGKNFLQLIHPGMKNRESLLVQFWKNS
ncbi:MAG: hypothetical protein ACYCYE_11145 [Clostridia bacterium]